MILTRWNLLTVLQNVQLDPKSNIIEQEVTDRLTGDKYIALTVEQGASVAEVESSTFSPAGSTRAISSASQRAKIIDRLHFVPYFFRSNRGGRGHSRVGLKRWTRQ